MSLLTGVLIGVLVWLVLLAAITAVFIQRMRKRGDRGSRMEDRLSLERRSSPDRRVGLPDPRPVQIERRRGPDRRRRADRRGGAAVA